MKSNKLSQLLFIVGLVVGLLSFWAGAAPFGAGGDLVTGGWTTCTVQGSNMVAATQGDCDPCNGTVVRYCFEGIPTWGVTCSAYGTITVVVGSAYGYTPHAVGSGSCSGSYPCWDVHDGDCY
jgi:hypothetical protein